MSAILAYLDKWDKEASSKISSMKTNIMMEYSLWVPMKAFSIYGLPILVGFGSFVFPLAEMEIKKIRIEELEENDRV